MEILEVKNLAKSFGPVKAVNNVSFSLGKGEILGLLGPNGAGKTTTIQMLLGVLQPSAGDIFYFGKNLKTDRRAILEQINFSSTYINLPWRLSVYENLNVIAHLYDIPDRKQRIAELAKTFELESLINQTIDTLSAGQITRLSLAKAFLNRPKVLLLDEPTASLDPDIAQMIRQYILQQRKQSGLSIIFTSHNMLEVEEICDRVIFINHGTIISDDTPENLAKTIQLSSIDLLDVKPLEKLQKYCAEQKFICEATGKRSHINLPEKQISGFLQDIAAQGITFSDISIDKPSLEDYFLTITNRQTK